MAQTIEYRSTILPWLYLAAAIVTEVVGTSFLAAASRNGAVIGYVVMAAAIALSYYFLAHALRRIAVGVAYAIWEGVGVTLLTLIAVLVFGDTLSWQVVIGLTIAIAGIVCVAIGEES